ncbi:hypothetical protein ACRYCC_07610 [Actinomadura scrupuli]|uniref:hypothetical protein n=1 Tax=Actinomadura scrupuli TaxID=559629 RepID=UPI003D97F317
MVVLVTGPQVPRFLFGEIVKITKATGQELQWDDLEFDQPVDVSALIGEEVYVNGARPTEDRLDWMCIVWAPSLQAMLTVPEEILEPTGRFEIKADGEQILGRPWRDDVAIDLYTLTHDVSEAENIARAAAAGLEALDDVREVVWEVTRWAHTPASVSMWAWSHGDALQLFAQVIAQAPDGWEESDGPTFINSLWDSAESTGQFLAPEVRTAFVTYRRWTNPARRSRTEINTTST